MIEISKSYKDYLKGLTKTNLMVIVNDYHELCDIYKLEKETKIEKKKKQEIIDYILNNISNYINCLVKTLDLADFETLKTIVNNSKKINDEFLVDNREFINYLIEKKLLNQKENLEITKDVNDLLIKNVNDKSVIEYVTKQNKIYTISNGVMVAYGVVDTKFFEDIISSYDENALLKIKYYYKKEYVVESKKIVSTKLTNKKRITNYFKNQDYKQFTNKDFIELGSMEYHHGIKSYKKLIKMLKNNYVFKNSDIIYVDKVIIIPYLYNSLNEEEIANKNLEETVIKLFEFKGDSLKNKMLEKIKDIRNDFPLWEYRGKTKNEVK